MQLSQSTARFLYCCPGTLNTGGLDFKRLMIRLTISRPKCLFSNKHQVRLYPGNASASTQRRISCVKASLPAQSQPEHLVAVGSHRSSCSMHSMAGQVKPALPPELTELPTEPAPVKSHLILCINGLAGHPDNWEVCYCLTFWILSFSVPYLSSGRGAQRQHV